MSKVESFYRLTEYHYRPEQERPYPHLDVFPYKTSYHRTREDALKALTRNAGNPEIYCFVLDELPMGIDVVQGEGLSETLFDGRGMAVSHRPFAVVANRGYDCLTFGEWIDWFNNVKRFDGWKRGDLKYIPGDIVEIHCRPGTMVVGNGGVELGIIVCMPPEPESSLSHCYGVRSLADECMMFGHAPVTAVMTPRFPVPDDLKFQLRDDYLSMTKDYGLR